MALRSPRFVNNQRLQRAAANNPPLRGVETGEAVRLLQQALIDLGFPMPKSIRHYGSPDGIYGDETKARVRDFQTQQGLSPDGEAGHDTMTRLDELLPGPALPLPPLPRPRGFNRVVNLHFRSISIPQVPEFTALRNAQRVYEQYAINMQFASGQSLLLPPDTQLELDAVDGTCQWDQVSDEQRLLHSLGGDQGVGPNDIRVFYANQIRQTDGSTLNGCAGHAPGRAAVVVASTGSPWTLGHEVGHVLLGSTFSPVHSTDPTNLMFSPTASITANPPHLTAEQLAVIRASQFCVVC
jgi:peptidoglycan hydrolase-like protein with peptidoglycan-binding domain